MLATFRRNPTSALLLDIARLTLAGREINRGELEMTLATAAASVTVLVGVAWSVWAALILGPSSRCSASSRG